MKSAQAERFRVASEALGRDPGNRRFEYGYFFDGIDFEGRAVLDIGAGDGDAGFFAACAGAASVVALEPEAAGSAEGAGSRFERVRERIDADNVELVAETLQGFDPGDRRFDVLVSIASINHLDERACARLPDDAEARAAYLEVLEKLARLAARGATLVVVDCSRRNLFGDLGITNPLAPTIEWDKHQPPGVWADLLEQVGFERPRTRWNSLNALRRPGRLLFGNRVGAYLMKSAFCLTMKRR